MAAASKHRVDQLPLTFFARALLSAADFKVKHSAIIPNELGVRDGQVCGVRARRLVFHGRSRGGGINKANGLKFGDRWRNLVEAKGQSISAGVRVPSDDSIE